MENLLDFVDGDEQRLQVFMSPLHNKAVNPLQFNSTVGFWKARILNFCIKNKKATFTTSDLFEHFSTGKKKPWCLPEVVTELINEGTVLDLASAFGKYSWKSWSANYLIWKPLQVGYSMLEAAKSYAPLANTSSDVGKVKYSESLMSKNLVAIELIEKFSADMLPNMSSADSSDCVFTPEEFKEQYLREIYCSETRDLIVASWIWKGVLKSGVNKGVQIYKLGKNSITEADYSMLEVRHSIKKFEEKVALREKEHSVLMGKVRSILKDGKRNEAKRTLRQAKLIEKELEKYANLLDQLLDTKAKMESANATSEYLDAVSGGTKVLKNINNQINLEAVHNTIAEMEEQSDMAGEISEALSSTKSPSSDDIETLEAELAKLAMPQETEPEIDLPRVPDTQISSLPDTPVSTKYAYKPTLEPAS